MTEAIVTITDLDSQNPNIIAKAVKIKGQLDESNVDEKAKDIYKVLESVPTGKHVNLLFDFAELDYMNSKSIGYLTDWYSRITTDGGKICIAGPKENIVDILQVVGLTQLVTC